MASIPSKTVLFTLLLTFMSIVSLAQQNHFFIELGGGYARAEDGIPSVELSSLQQLSPSLRLAVGYSINANLSVIAQYIAVAEMKANGVVKTTSQTVELRPSFHTIAFDLVGTVPIEKISLELFGGPAYLRQRLVREEQNQSGRTLVTGNVGLHLAAGVRYQFTERVSTALRFDFMNPFGDTKHWEGDVGVVNVALRYSLTRKNL